MGSVLFSKISLSMSTTLLASARSSLINSLTTSAGATSTWSITPANCRMMSAFWVTSRLDDFGRARMLIVPELPWNYAINHVAIWKLEPKHGRRARSSWRICRRRIRYLGGWRWLGTLRFALSQNCARAGKREHRDAEKPVHSPIWVDGRA